MLNTWWTRYWHRRILKQSDADPIQNYIAALPSKKISLAEAPILALDFETTGLNPKQDHIISMGWVELNHFCIHLSTAEHHLVRSSRKISPENLAIHQITEEDIAQGLPYKQAIDKLLKKLSGKILLAHHAQIEVQFIKQACYRLYGVKPKLAVMDTLRIEQKRRERRQQAYRSQELRLFELRKHYYLAEYPAHHALYDALSCAEVFLAQINDYKQKPILIQSFLHYI